MEELPSTILESREDLMISPTGEGIPTLRLAHFLKPSITSIDEPISKKLSSSLSLSSLPPTFEPKNRPLSVTFHGWRFPPTKWKAWVDKMASLHKSTWKKAGIYEAILNSTYQIHRNSDLVLGVAERWCPETKSFIFPWGEATISLEDIMIVGYSVLGSPVFSPLETEELKGIEEKLIQARKEIVRTRYKKACQRSWLTKFMDTGNEIEHEAFLALWLSRFVLPTSFDVVCKCHFPIAVHLARGTRIALAPAVLASIYRDLSLLKENIVALTTLGTHKGNGDEDDDDDALAVTIWSPFQLVQIWVWERFVELQPKPNLIKIGELRLARWDNVKCKVENVRLALDLAKETFNWRPYSKPVQNWDNPKFYKEQEMWLSVDSGLDEQLLSFLQCLRVSELVGLDCVEQYLPHRVAMQFGIDQDIPGNVAPCTDSPEIAWSCYSRPISDEKCYIPSCLFEADVTTRYLGWWKHSVLALQAAGIVLQQQKSLTNFRTTLMTSKEKKKSHDLISSFKIRPKCPKEKKAGDGFKSLRVLTKRCKGMKRNKTVSTFKITTKALKGAKKGASFISSFKITPRRSEEKKESDGAHLSPEFPPSSSKSTSPQILKPKNSNNALVAIGAPVNQSKILAKRPKGKKEANASASPGFSQNRSEESAGSRKRKKVVKAVRVSHGLPLKSSIESALSLKGKKKNNDPSIANEFPSKKSMPSLNGKNEENEKAASPYCPTKFAKSLAPDFAAVKEINNQLVPPGFPPKCNKVKDKDSISEDKLTIADLLKSKDKFASAESKQYDDSENLSSKPPIHSSSVVDNEAAKTSEPATSVEKVVHGDTVDKSQGSDGKDTSSQPQSHSSSVADNEACKLDPLMLLVGDVRQNKAFEDRQDDDGRNASGQSGQLQRHSHSIAGDEAAKILEPEAIPAEKVVLSETATVVAKPAVGDAKEIVGCLVHKTASVNGNWVGGSSYSFETPVLKLEARITRLEQKLAEQKAAKFGHIRCQPAL